MDNYKLLQEEEIVDIGGKGKLYQHEKSGALVVCLENNDNNKALAIAFRTPPTNDEGIPHILEHSVLCGSDRFPLKDPFVQLLKGSLNTFLNAMTASQFTIYPVSSINNSDFKTLNDVYLDAVFAPNLRKESAIIGQEGWHYEVDDNNELYFNGVVFNEMKGNSTSPFFILNNEIDASLFPDTDKGKVSGGLPLAIVDLSQEEALEYYNNHYHPANSIIFFYGDLDMQERLTYLDQHYLSKFDKQDAVSYTYQKAFDSIKEVESTFPVNEEKELEKNVTYASAYVVDDRHDPEKLMALSIIDYCLLTANSAILKRKLIEKGIGEDFDSYLDTSCLQPVYSISVRKALESQKEEFYQCVEEVLSKCANEGLESKLVEACLHDMEYSLREDDYGRTPRGLIYAMRLSEKILYGEDNPFDYLKQREVFAKLKEDIKSGYLENIIKECFLENKHQSRVTLKPSLTWNQEFDKALNDKLNERVSQMSEADKQAAIAESKRIYEYRQKEEDEETLNCIPLLKREELNSEEKEIPNIISSLDESVFYHHDLDANGISYLSILFDCGHLSESELSYLGLLSRLFTRVDTENYSYQSLEEEIGAKTGGLSFRCSALTRLSDESLYRYLQVNARYIEEEANNCLELLKEICFKSNFTDKKRIKEIMEEYCAGYETGVSYRADDTAVSQAAIQISKQARVEDLFTGRGYYHFIKDLLDDYDTKFESIQYNLNHLVEVIFNKQAIISYTGKNAELAKEVSSNFLEKLSDNCYQEKEISLAQSKEALGLQMASQVQYCAMVSKLNTPSIEKYAHRHVLSHILSRDYLWQNIRVMGGAYGASAQFSRSGMMSLSTYRDPNCDESLNVLHSIPAYIRNFEADEMNMRRYVIGSMNGFDMPTSIAEQGHRALLRNLQGISQEDLSKLRQAVIACQKEDIKALADEVENALITAKTCVVGNEDKIKASKQLKEKENLF